MTELESIVNDPEVRRQVAWKSHLLFFTIYFSHYMSHGFAPFQQEMFALSESTLYRLKIIMAFRGSGKSSIMNTSLALWSVMGIQQKKLVLIVSDTQEQARSHFMDVRRELENNELLRSDLGPFNIEESVSSYGLVLPGFGAKIQYISRRESIRGIKYGAKRPDLIICDDLEDSRSVAKQKQRDELSNWFMSEIVPLGDANTTIVVLGNLLHEDSLLMRLRAYAQEHPERAIFRAYPLLDDFARCLWNEGYSESDIQAIRSSVPVAVFAREFLLKIVPESIDTIGTQKDMDKHHEEFIADEKRLSESALHEKYFSQCARCLARDVQMPLINAMGTSFCISAPLTLRSMYVSPFNCCVLTDAGNIANLARLPFRFTSL